MPDTPLRDVTAEEIAAFHRDGAVLVKQVLPESWVEVVLAGLDHAIAEPDVMSATSATYASTSFPQRDRPICDE